MENGGLPPVYVVLDLETTGLNPDEDTIIEIGAVKFQGQQVLETYHTLVNPYRSLPQFIRNLTGIAQLDVDRAPSFGAVSGQLRAFIGDYPVVGHNVSFDLNFLSKHGLRLNNDVCDTRDLASVLMPRLGEYSLARLVAEAGSRNSRPHRALPDAQATREVFLDLLQRAAAVEPSIAAYARFLASRARWPLGRLFEGQPSETAHRGPGLGLTGLDMDSLAKRLQNSKPSGRTSRTIQRVDEDTLASYLAPGGLFSRAFPSFEYRPQQVEMMRAVARAINCPEHIIVEGATGVGKSIAYLLPAILHALTNGTRVVVSTNTIGLQEQLLHKDVPAIVGVLEKGGVIPEGELRAVPLKGRANYLCLRRWNNLAAAETLSADEASLLVKTLVWLQDSSTGDRAEINLSGKGGVAWSRICADEKGHCPGIRGEGLCFLRASRDWAEDAHIIIVNHALLLSDLRMGGGLLPDYQYLIIDEAHHLEEEATRQLGFQVSQNFFPEELDNLGRLLGQVRMLTRASASSGQAQRAQELMEELGAQWPRRARQNWDRLWELAATLFNSYRAEGAQQPDYRITRSTRAQPVWSDLEIAWENVDAILTEGIRQMDRLCRFLDAFPQGGPVRVETVMPDLSSWQEGLEELQERLKNLLVAPGKESRIDWMTQVEYGKPTSAAGSYMVLHSAPLNVGPELETRLFSKKSSVVLTGATLSVRGNFDYIHERVGLVEGKEATVGSPFDYRRAALLLISDDIPMPDAWEYQSAMENLLVGIAKSLEGRTLALFTSHAALQGAARALRPLLEPEDIRVLAQGVDGSPARITQSFSQDPRAVLLGTSTFWEGVDLSGGVLKALVITRLPFHVPTEPVFAARSAEYEDPFNHYALPQAILRFRQGIGRLIRSAEDKGAIVVLDRRIIAKPYGRAFLDSIPRCTVKREPLSAIPTEIVAWIGNKI